MRRSAAASATLARAMANNPLLYDQAAGATINAFTALLNSGTLKIYAGAQPAVDAGVTGTLLATLTFGATAFSAAVGTGGWASANTIASGIAGNTGTAGYFVLVESNGTTVVATGTVGTRGCDLNLNTTNIVAGDPVSCTAFTVHYPLDPRPMTARASRSGRLQAVGVLAVIAVAELYFWSSAPWWAALGFTLLILAAFVAVGIAGERAS
jgi:hypothetical protein